MYPNYVILKRFKEDLEIRNLVNTLNVIKTKPNDVSLKRFKDGPEKMLRYCLPLNINVTLVFKRQLNGCI